MTAPDRLAAERIGGLAAAKRLHRCQPIRRLALFGSVLRDETRLRDMLDAALPPETDDSLPE